MEATLQINGFDTLLSTVNVLVDKVNEQGRQISELLEAFNGKTQGLLTREETAALLGVNVRTVDNLRKLGQIPCTKVGRLVKFSDKDIREYKQRRTSHIR